MSIIQNAVYIPSEDFYLVSTHVHDYRTWTSKDGKRSVSVDGGGEYIRRGFTGVGFFAENNLTDKDDFITIAANLLWGSRGKNGELPEASYRPIKDLTLPHLRAILRTQEHIKGTIAEKVVKFWIKQNAVRNMKKRTKERKRKISKAKKK